MLQQNNSLLNTHTSTSDTLSDREGFLGSTGKFLKEKTERFTRIQEFNPHFAFHKNDCHTDEYSYDDLSNSNDVAIGSEYFEEWMVDFHKIKSRPLDDFFSKQKYEGIVLEVTGESFVARLRNLTDDLLDEEAKFAIEDLSSDDLVLLKKGAMFYWNIGYLVVSGGRKIGCHMINFRRLPVWTSREIDIAKERAADLLAWIESN